MLARRGDPRNPPVAQGPVPPSRGLGGAGPGARPPWNPPVAQGPVPPSRGLGGAGPGRDPPGTPRWLKAPFLRHGALAVTWLDLPPGTGFGVLNLPFGIFSTEPAGGPRAGAAIGDQVLDVAAVADDLRLPLRELFAEPALNRFLAAGPAAWREARERITEWLTSPAHRAVVQPHLVPLAGARLHLPFAVADYVDFYASRNHAENVGAIFRPGQPPLPRNWLHMPLGYHGRAGSVVVSGTPLTRPHGQRREPGADGPSFGPSLRLDFEAEVGFVAGVPSRQGEPVPVDDFERHVFGACLVNDWSARDIQSFETVPLGPFLGKAFATSVSPGWCRSPRSARPGSLPRRGISCRRPIFVTARIRGAWTSAWRSGSTAAWSAARRSPPCTGPRRRCSPTSPAAVRRCAPATCSRQARSAGQAGISLAACWN